MAYRAPSGTIPSLRAEIVESGAAVSGARVSPALAGDVAAWAGSCESGSGGNGFSVAAVEDEELVDVFPPDDAVPVDVPEPFELVLVAVVEPPEPVLVVVVEPLDPVPVEVDEPAVVDDDVSGGIRSLTATKATRTSATTPTMIIHFFDMRFPSATRGRGGV